MADERTTPALPPSAAPRDGRQAFSRPPDVPSRSPSPSEPGLDVADSHARPIAGPESAKRPAATPIPATWLSPRPPVPQPGFLPPPNPSDEPMLGFEDSLEDELTPVSVTKPSLPFEAIPPSGPLAAVRPVVVLDSLDAFDPLLAPLPPSAVIEPPPGGYRTSYRSDDPPPSGPVSSGRPPTSVAPPMPQIPKPVSARPMIHAPGIVSTQAIPLTVPAKKKRERSLLFVAFAAALIGGMIALAIALSMKAKAKHDVAAAQEAASAALAPASPTAEATGAAAPPASGAAPVASAGGSPASAVSAAPVVTAATKASASTSAAPAAPPASPPRAPRKSDRIED